MLYYKQWIDKRKYLYVKSLLNCALCAPPRVRVLPIINTLLTHLCAYSPYSSFICALRALRAYTPLPWSRGALLVLSCYKYRCVCLPPWKQVNITRNNYGPTWTHEKMWTFSFRPETPFSTKFSPKNQNC